MSLNGPLKTDPKTLNWKAITWSKQDLDSSWKIKYELRPNMKENNKNN